ncbi:signal peptidase II [Paenibacillus spongiae]|uniref:Lipoprotein signal peptidase n=1 Tax=Paenibacillus spongiae TaxID=2909671 RepID=A0ABY5SJ45_9BACL|nr:signal peptidase II [Paenibacillus spongiae]
MKGSDELRFYYYWIALFVFAIDYVTKKIVETQMELYQEIEILGGFFVITSHRNKGAAFGILQEQTTFFIIITLLVVTGIVWYIQKNRITGSRMLLIGLGLVLGGAFGNFLDRALYGEVVDFLQFTFGSYVYPIFNLADSGIVCGVALILIDSLRSIKNENGEKNGSTGQGQEGQQPQQPAQ